MRVLVFGTGGVGGYFGARLAQAGHDVQFIARGRHLEALRRDGLRLRSILGDVHIDPVDATETVKAAFRPDLVLVCVKTWQLEPAARALASSLADHTIVLPLLNGVEAPGILAGIVGERHVAPGLCGLIAYIESPGVVRHAAVPPFLKFGEPDNRKSARLAELRTVFERTAHVDAEIPDDIHAALWMKFLFVASTGAVGALTRAPMGVIRTEPEARALLGSLMTEIQTLAAARGVALGPSAVEATLNMVDALPASATVSMQRDLMEGRPSELEGQIGAIVRLGRESGVATPVSDLTLAAFLPGERRARGELDYPG